MLLRSQQVCYSISSISFWQWKARPVLLPCGQTNQCKTNSTNKFELSTVRKKMFVHFVNLCILCWWWNLHQGHCTHSLMGMKKLSILWVSHWSSSSVQLTDLMIYSQRMTAHCRGRFQIWSVSHTKLSYNLRTQPKVKVTTFMIGLWCFCVVFKSWKLQSPFIVIAR